MGWYFKFLVLVNGNRIKVLGHQHITTAKIYAREGEDALQQAVAAGPLQPPPSQLGICRAINCLDPTPI